MLMSYLIEINIFTLRIIMMSTIVGAIGGLNQTSIRKILTYSSINHTGWILIALTTSESLWIVYFAIYSTLALTVVAAIKLSGVSFINQTIITNKETTLIKFIIFTSLLSLGGLPPFLGFLPKWIVIQAIITNNIIPLAVIVVVTSLITLYYYLKISYSSFLILNAEPKWNIKPHKNQITTNLRATILSSVSLMGIAACTIITNIY
jgi:NADH-ubiquinone oxidoreductase chain 2